MKCNRILFLSGTALASMPAVYAQQEKPNVLMICIDDLRRDLGCYGAEVLTPNMDRLASEGSLFYNQYVSAPTSGASRYGVLTGWLPREMADLSNDAAQLKLSGRPETERPETFIHQLRRNGYHTVGIGKVSHSADGYLYPYNGEKSDRLELPYSWDEMLSSPGMWQTGWKAFFGYSNGESRQSMDLQVKPYECAEVDESVLPDARNAALAVSRLEELSQTGQPFFMAVGFYKPHLPFVSPKKYWDLYDEDKISLSEVPDIPAGFNLQTLHNSGEFGTYRKGDEKASLSHRVSDAYARKLRHAYFACVSYVDAQVGKVLEALEENGLAENTVVVLWGDHGWHLGDFRIWGKHTLYETALNSVFMIKAPGHKTGLKNHRIVSSMDIYPTLMELCGVRTPDGLDGRSLVPLLDNPSDPDWEDRAYSYYKHGVTVRVPGYRLSCYKNKGQEWTELYRYGKSRMEKKNIAGARPALTARLYETYLKEKAQCLDEVYGNSSSEMTVEIINDSNVDRLPELAEISFEAIRSRLFLKKGEAFQLLDSNGEEIPYQQTSGGSVVFPVRMSAWEKQIVTFRPGVPASMDTLAFGKLYPARMDDLAWENDRVAFRAYGPAVQRKGERAFGYDLFAKRGAATPVLPEMYDLVTDPVLKQQVRDLKKTDPEESKRIQNLRSYHVDKGYGMDCYAVGPTLGAGAAALVHDGEIIYPWCWDSYEILDNGPLRFSVRLTFTPFRLGEEEIVETRVITLDAGSHLNRTLVSYSGLKDTTAIVTGIVLHDDGNYVAQPGLSYISYQDPTTAPGQGQLYLGHVFPQPLHQAARVLFSEEEAASRNKAAGHILATSSYQPGSEFEYWWGFGWNRSDIPSFGDWNSYLETFARQLKKPLRVYIY